MDENAAVAAEGLVKTYRARAATVEAVRGVDLRVERGEIFGFLGPNGAGKSTTVRMLTTLLTLTSGTARVAGLDVAREPDAVRRRIGVALQEAGLDPRQTGRELLVEKGYDPTMGARPLRRAIQSYIEDPLADYILGRELEPGSTILVARKNAEEVDITVVPPTMPEVMAVSATPDAPPEEITSE